jgi:hypothetical protein
MIRKELPVGYGPPNLRFPPFQKGEWLLTPAYTDDHLVICDEDQEDPPIAWCGRTLMVDSNEWWVVASARKGNKCGTCKTRKRAWDEMAALRHRQAYRDGRLNEPYDFLVNFDGLQRLVDLWNMDDDGQL